MKFLENTDISLQIYFHHAIFLWHKNVLRVSSPDLFNIVENTMILLKVLEKIFHFFLRNFNLYFSVHLKLHKMFKKSNYIFGLSCPKLYFFWILNSFSKKFCWLFSRYIFLKDDLIKNFDEIIWDFEI